MEVGKDCFSPNSPRPVCSGWGLLLFYGSRKFSEEHPNRCPFPGKNPRQENAPP